MSFRKNILRRLTIGFVLPILALATMGLTTTPLPPTSWLPEPNFPLGWQSQSDLKRLFSANKVSMAYLNGGEFGSVRSDRADKTRIIWEPLTGPKLRGTLTISDGTACFAYQSGTYCYRYYNDGRAIIAYFQGAPNHRISSRDRGRDRDSGRGPGSGRIGENQTCPTGQAMFCGSSNCSGNGPRAICTMDMRCRCEPGGKPVWDR